MIRDGPPADGAHFTPNVVEDTHFWSKIQAIRKWFIPNHIVTLSPKFIDPVPIDLFGLGRVMTLLSIKS